jgi:antitoxin component YwqK of YwqJK toxin-antitoxin module
MKIIFAVFLLFATASFAQKHNTYFVKNNGQIVNVRDSADFIRIVSEPDSATVLYNVKEYFLTGKIKLMSKSSTIDPQTYEGQMVVFYENGKRKATENYKHGKPIQIYNYYPTGILKDYIEYPDSLNINGAFQNFRIAALNDSTGKALVINGNGYYAGYEDMAPERYNEGRIVNGQREGVWHGTYAKENATFTEEYKNGMLISGECTTANNKKYSYKTFQQQPFLGDLNEWATSAMKSIHVDSDDVPGRVKISFVIDKNAELRDFKVTQSINDKQDLKALNAVKKAVKNIKGIVPGIQYGHTVNILYTIPIPF